LVLVGASGVSTGVGQAHWKRGIPGNMKWVSQFELQVQRLLQIPYYVFAIESSCYITIAGSSIHKAL
jgi:hypothetical protein